MRTYSAMPRAGCTGKQKLSGKNRFEWMPRARAWKRSEAAPAAPVVVGVADLESGGPAVDNVERRFRRFAEARCPERARLLDTSVEECALVDQAPPSKTLRTLLEQLGPPEPGEPYGTRSAARRWHRQVPQPREGFQARTTRQPRAERRDEGIAREPRPDRKRAAASDAAAAGSPSKRARVLAEAAPDLAPLAPEAARASGSDPVCAAATVVPSVAKREGKARERNLGRAKATAKEGQE